MTKRETEDVPRHVLLERVVRMMGNDCPFATGNFGSQHCSLRWTVNAGRYRDHTLRCPVEGDTAPAECPLREGAVTIWPLPAMKIARNEKQTALIIDAQKKADEAWNGYNAARKEEIANQCAETTKASLDAWAKFERLNMWLTLKVRGE